MMTMDPMETSTTISFHGVAYVVTVSVANQMLEIQVEIDERERSSVPHAASEYVCWTARFPATYVEDLTRKTGNFKRFPVFVNMLLSAISHRSDAVFIDLLTTADLELYRKRKMGRSHGSGHAVFDSPGTEADKASMMSKRYLILTYAVEFDRVHYPLPLQLVETPTPETLQRTIRRLRQALTTSTTESKAPQLQEEIAALREENRCLKNTLQQYCGSDAENGGDARNLRERNGSGDQLDLQRELEASMQENKELIKIYQQLREDSTAEITRLRAEIKQLKLAQNNGTVDYEQDLERERQENRRKLSDSKAAAQEALIQLKRMQNELEESKLKNKELLRQLAIARVKNGQTSSSTPSTRRSRQTVDSSKPSATRTTGTQRRTSTAYRRNSPSQFHSDSEDDDHLQSNGRGRSPSTQTTRRQPFRRFDPTAYQAERERKLQERRAMRSPSPSRSTRSTEETPSFPRRRRNPASTSGVGGYTSDSSAGGYSSADSNGSKASRSTLRSRGRSRVAYERQREAVDRLASPKRAPIDGLPPSGGGTPTNSRFRSPVPRAKSSSNVHAGSTQHTGRSPSPARSQASTNGTARRTKPPRSDAQSADSPMAASRGSNGKAKKETRPQRAAPARRPIPAALAADTSMDSFSDIDDRLTALQQFLKEAKQGRAVSNTSMTDQNQDGV